MPNAAEKDIQNIGVADGESWAETAERLRGRDDDCWHYCVCGARYRSRGPALKCCSDRFAERITDGGTQTATETEHYADGSFVTCPDCGGDLNYQNQEVVLCTDCDAEFSHFYADNGTNELCRAPDMERVTTVYDPADDQRDDEELVTDGGQDQTPLDRLFIEDAADRPDEIVVENLTTLDADEFVARLESLAEAAETVSELTADLERLRQTGLSDDDARDLIYGRNAGVAKRDIEALFDAVDQLKDGRTKRDPSQRLLAEVSGLSLSDTSELMDELDRLRHRYGGINDDA
ncbi:MULTISPECIES: hypothetical protein [unclassified Haloarcula]|uniref:hypothetical protein n=1 Tax=unclassified Haloarcula TaxID=2624677 RepID=UPI000EF19C09|nr:MULTISPECIES: hypothetical protein [unclassified Haloarcula]RLM34086.1 hypothetical protein DVK01_16585 [Haloarcula sp. Atlit-120R]RLM42341.1 hypothetical protein DVK00_14795 [Haloarcula sp. Atlit-47R]